MDIIMITKNKYLPTFVIVLLLNACGSSSTEEAKKATYSDEKEEQGVTENTAKHEVTELKAIPMNANETLEGSEMENLKEKLKDEFSGWQRGRVHFLNLEGGFYGIITDSGKKILPMNMSKEFAQNGAIVRIKGKVKDIMTIQQWGTPFTITDIELIKPGRVGNGIEM